MSMDPEQRCQSQGPYSIHAYDGLRLPHSSARSEPARQPNTEHPYEVVLCYRNNDQFSTHIPRIIYNLRLSGFKVSTIPFEESQDRNDIAAELLANSERLHGKIVLTDETVKNSLDEMASDLGFLPGELDRCFELGKAQALLESQGRDHLHLQYRVTIDDARDIFVALFADALQNIVQIGQPPDRIVLFADKLHDHGPFCHEDVLNLDQRMHELARKNPQEYHRRSMYNGRMVKEWLDQSIREAGLDSDIAPRIHLVFQPYDVLDLDIRRSERVWFIGDSHVYQSLEADLKRADTMRDTDIQVNSPPPQSERFAREADLDDDEARTTRVRRDVDGRPFDRNRSEYEDALAHKLESERRLEAEIREISLRGGRAIRVRAALSILGLDDSSRLSDEIKADQSVNRIHMPLPLPHLIGFFDDHKLLSPPVNPAESDEPQSADHRILSEIKACIAQAELRLQGAA